MNDKRTPDTNDHDEVSGTGLPHAELPHNKSPHNESHHAEETPRQADQELAQRSTDINHNRHHSSALEQLQQRYNAVLDSMISYFVELDCDWRIQSLSQIAADVVNKPVAELVGRVYSEAFPHDYATFKPYCLEARASGQVVVFETLSRQRIGSWLSVYVYPQADGLLIYALDISAQRKAEKAFKQSRERLELLRQQSPLGIIEWDNDFRILTWNAAAETIFGFTEDDILGESYTAFVPHDQRKQVSEVLAETLTNKVITHNVNSNLTKEGAVITCEWYNVPLTTADGQVVGVTGLVQDVSREQQAIDKLTRLAEFRRKLVDINRDILQRDLDNDLYQHLLEQAIATIPQAQAGSIVISNSDGYYEFVAAYGYDLAQLKHLQLREQDLAVSSDGRAARVYHEDFKDKLKSLTPEDYGHFREVGRVHEIHVTLSVPINTGQARKGILFIDNLEVGDAFGNDALEMAEIFAGQIGVYLRRLRLEKELREREVRNRALLEALPDTISRHDEAGRYLDVRPGMSFSSHHSPTELLGKPLQALMGDENQDAIQAFQEAHDKARQTKRIQHAEYSFMFEGKRQYREVRVVATEALQALSSDRSQAELAEKVETIAIVRDISRQKAAEQAVLESEARYRIISDVITDVLYAYKRNDQGGFSRDWSSGLGEVKLTGYKTQEIDALGGWPAIVHPDDTAKVNYLSHPSRRERVVVEYRIISKSGSIKWVRDFSRAVFDASGAMIIALYGANQDITEHKVAARALESAKSELERALAENNAILESITDSFVSVNDTWQLSYINNRALSYTSLDSAEAALGTSYFEVFPFVKEHDLETVFADTLAQQSPKQLELFWRERYIWLEMRIYPTRSGLAIYATDISERKHMELALTASNRELNQHVDEMAALNAMMRTLTTATTVTQALELAVPVVAKLLHLDYVSISLLEAKHVTPQAKVPKDKLANQLAKDKNPVDVNPVDMNPVDVAQAEANVNQPQGTLQDSLSATPEDASKDSMTYLHEVVRYEDGQITRHTHREAMSYLHEDRAALLAVRDNTAIYTPNVVAINAVQDVQESTTMGSVETAAVEKVVANASSTPDLIGVNASVATPSTEVSADQLQDSSQHHSGVTLALRAQQAPIGILRLGLTGGRVLKDAEMELAQTVAGQIASAVSNLRLLEVQQRINRDMQETNRQLEDTKAQLELKNKRLVTLSTRDALTGIYNRRHLETQLSKEFARAVRYNIPLSVMLCDIDDFKQVNDSFSHAVGDEVLRRVAAIMQQNTRDVDLVARYGGEEFVVVFPETSYQAALHACEKIRHLVETHPWQELARGLQVTLSQGISDDLKVNNHEELLSRADKLLYKAKGAGKNRIATIDAILPS
ncbi:MAG: diguanylate cyclase [Deinococcota bacterium]